MKILVLGAGAIGSVFGGLLAKSGNRVCLVGRKLHLNAISQRGLFIEGIWGTHRIHNLACYESLSEAAMAEPFGFDVVLLTVKSYDTEAALKELSAYPTISCPIVSLQNGLGNIEKIAQFFGKEKTIGGRVIFGVEFIEPGRVSVTVSADKTVIGALSADSATRFVKDLADVFNASHLPTAVTDNIHKYIWGKVLYNCALNGLATIMNDYYGALLSCQASRNIMSHIIEEIFSIIYYKKIDSEWHTPEHYQDVLFNTLIPRTFKHHPSMLQDILRHKKTEIDALNGAIVTLGKEAGIDVPFNWAVSEFIRAKESMSIERANQPHNG